MSTKDCPDCDETGGSFRPSDGKCSTCHGTGKDSVLASLIDLATGGSGDCEVCSGSGKCQTCHGSGEVDDDD